MLATANFREDTVLLDLFVEPPKSALKGLTFTDFDLRQLEFTSPGRFELLTL